MQCRATLITMVDVPDHDAVRRSYDSVADEYAASFGDELSHKPLDRALLASLIEQAGPDVPVADLGCGPGHVTAWLAGRGAAAVGIDISAGMLAMGRRDHPGLEFRRGDLLSLPARDGEFGAAVAFYSIIHLQPGELPRACQEVFRVLRPGGFLLVSFHAGTEVRHFAEWWGREVDLDFRFLETSDVTSALEGAGLVVTATLERASYPGEVGTRRVYLLAKREA